MSQNSKEVSIKCEERGTYYFIQISGFFAGKNILQLRKVLEEALEIGHTRIAIDLADVMFIDSMGIGTLVNVKKKVDEISGTFGLVNPSDQVRTVFDSAELHQIIPIYYEKPENVDHIFD